MKRCMALFLFLALFLPMTANAEEETAMITGSLGTIYGGMIKRNSR